MLKLASSIITMIGFIGMAPAILIMIAHSKPKITPVPTPERKLSGIFISRKLFKQNILADTGFFNSRNWFKYSYAEDEPTDKIPRRKGRLSRAADKSAIAAGSAVKFALLTPFILASNIKGKVDSMKKYE